MSSRFIKQKVEVRDPDAQTVRRHGEAMNEPAFSLREGSIFFLGPRGSGKSTLAREVASRLQAPAVDTDSRVEERAGRSISQIVSCQGWEAFRDLEQQVLRRICSEPGHVVATGGGIVLRRENRELLRKSGPVFYLLADVSLLLQRLQDEKEHQSRPSLTNESLEQELVQTLRERDPLYQECLDYILPAERTPPELADNVVSTLGVG